jgi:hypothetical protein
MHFRGFVTLPDLAQMSLSYSSTYFPYRIGTEVPVTRKRGGHPSAAPRVDYSQGQSSQDGSGAAGWCGGHSYLLGQAGGASWGWTA